ncbi:MAG: aldehyde dehydrogenase family protein [Anaerotruncus massiliensis (ex Togo et al. 2019)]
MKMLISGNWVDAANRATIDVTNPYDGKLLETVPNAAKEDVDRAIADAVTAQKQWNRVIVRERAKILRRYLELLTEYRDELARTLTLETGKPIFDSYGEIDSVYMTFESSIEIVKHQYGKTMPMGIEGGYDDDLQVTVHEPLGVIACIVPFNFPAALWAFKAGPALMAGNAIVVKPATSNPLTVLKLMGLLVEAGVTPGAVQCVTGRGSTVGNWISDNPSIAQLNLTGGVEAGKEIARHAAENLTAYKFELGGNDPLIICADCDMDLAVNEAGDKTRNAGQCCSGAKRFIVHESIKDEFVTRLIEERLKTVKEGDLMDLETDFGVLISEAAAKEVEQQVQHTIGQGAKLVYGGVRRGAYYMPTVLDNCTKNGYLQKHGDLWTDLPIFTSRRWMRRLRSLRPPTTASARASSRTTGRHEGGRSLNGHGRRQRFPRVSRAGAALRRRQEDDGNSQMVTSVLEEVTQEKSIIFRYAMKKYHES